MLLRCGAPDMSACVDLTQLDVLCDQTPVKLQRNANTTLAVDDAKVSKHSGTATGRLKAAENCRDQAGLEDMFMSLSGSSSPRCMMSLHKEVYGAEKIQKNRSQERCIFVNVLKAFGLSILDTWQAVKTSK